MPVFYRTRTLAAAGFILTCVLWGTSSYSQTPSSEDVGDETAIVEAMADTVSPAQTLTLGDPGTIGTQQATTLNDPDIEVEDLVLLVKPFTLEQLEYEATGWLLLLQNKVQQVSEAEIAIKRENRAIDAEKEAIQKLEDAQTKLDAAYEAQENAAPNTPEYEDAKQKKEAAQNALIEAEESIAAAVRTEQEILDDPALKSVLEDARDERAVTLAQDILKAREDALEKLSVGSPKYASTIEQFDTLATSLRNLERTQDELQSVPADSAEYEVLQDNKSEVLDTVRVAALALTQQIPGLVEDTSALADLDLSDTPTDSEFESQKQAAPELNEKSEATLDHASSTLEQVDEQINSDNITSSTVRQTEQKLEQFSAEIQDSVEQERELKNQLVINVTNLQSEQTAIADRLKVVLDELDAKGGDSSSYRNYIQSVSGIEIDVTDTEGLGVRLVSWLQSEEGGGRWGHNLMIFSIVFVITMIVAQIFALCLRFIMFRFTESSSLLQEFVVAGVRRGGVVAGILLALVALEVSLTPILAVLGGASFVLAFALQSNLSNVASGMLMMWYKPFDVDDHVQVAGVTGFVQSISLTNTIIRANTYDTFIMPNELVWSGVIQNSTVEGKILREVLIHVSFKENLCRVEHLLIDIANSHPDVLEEPAPQTLIRVGESFVVICLRPWMRPQDYDRVPSDLYRMIIGRFQQEGIMIALPAAVEFSPTELNQDFEDFKDTSTDWAVDFISAKNDQAPDASVPSANGSGAPDINRQSVQLARIPSDIKTELKGKAEKSQQAITWLSKRHQAYRPR